MTTISSAWTQSGTPTVDSLSEHTQGAAGQSRRVDRAGIGAGRGFSSAARDRSSLQSGQMQPAGPRITPATDFQARPKALVSKREIRTTPPPAGALTTQTGGADPLKNPDLDAYVGELRVKDHPLDPRHAARQFVKGYLKERGVKGDPDQIFLITHFPPSKTLPHGYDEKIMSMTDMVLQNRQEEFQDWSYGYVTTDLKGPDQVPGLDVADFRRYIWNSDFAKGYADQIKRYFDKNQDAIARGIHGGLAKTVTKQVHEGSLSAEGANIVSRGLGLGNHVDWSQRTREDFEHPKPSDGVTVSPLVIHGAVSTKAFVFTDDRTGKIVLYTPGNSSPFHEMKDAGELSLWFRDRVAYGTQEAKQQFRSYFPDEEPHYVDKAIARYQEVKLSTPDEGLYLLRPRVGEAIKGNAVAGMIEIQKQSCLTAGDEQITSDAEWGRRLAGQVLDVVNFLLAPLALVMPEWVVVTAGVGVGGGQMGLGIYMATKGPSSRERQDGKRLAVFGFLNAAGNTLGIGQKLVGKGSLGEIDTPSVVKESVPPPTVAIEDSRLHPVGDGTYLDGLSRRYVKMGGKTYQVVQDGQTGKLQVVDSGDPYAFGNKTFLKPDGKGGWEFAGKEGLRGGVDDASTSSRISSNNSQAIPASLRISGTYPAEGDARILGLRFDPAQSAWRSVDGQYWWRRAADGAWESGTVKEFRSAAKKEALYNTTYEVPAIPAIPASSEMKPIPKVVHYVWIGGEMPKERLDNIIGNATNSPGYQHVVHVDVEPADLAQISRGVEGNNVLVKNLRDEPFYERFKASRSFEAYEFFKKPSSKNFSAASDVIRYPLLDEYGGVYMDCDDTLESAALGSLKAKPGDILLGYTVDLPHGTRKTGFNTSVFATHPDSPQLKAVTEEMVARFDREKGALENRPWSGKGASKEELQRYYGKIFDVTGPSLFNDVIDRYNPELAELDVAAQRLVRLNGDVALDRDLARMRAAVRYYQPLMERTDADLLRTAVANYRERVGSEDPVIDKMLRWADDMGSFPVHIGSDHSWENTR